MEFKKDQLSFVVPDLHDILHILVDLPNEVVHALVRVTPGHMKKLQEKSDVGLPSAYSIEGNKVSLYPRADRDYPEVRVVFIPPPQEL
jgi:hypothetical protein